MPATDSVDDGRQLGEDEGVGDGVGDCDSESDGEGDGEGDVESEGDGVGAGVLVVSKTVVVAGYMVLVSETDERAGEEVNMRAMVLVRDKVEMEEEVEMDVVAVVEGTAEAACVTK